MVAGLNPNAQPHGIGKQQPVAEVPEFIPPENVESLLGGLQTIVENQALVIDTEIMGMSKNMVKLEQKLASEDMKGLQKTKEGRMPEMIEALIEALAADNLDRKTRKGKKTPLEQKLEELSQLEKLVDMALLSPEERQEFEKLFDNLARIKQAQGKIAQLEDQEDALEERLKREQQEAERESREQGQGQPQGEAQDKIPPRDDDEPLPDAPELKVPH